MRRGLLVLCAAAVLGGPAIGWAQAPRAETVHGLDAASQRQLYLDLIARLRLEGSAHAALAHLDAFDQQYPKDPEAQVLRADCLNDVGEAAEAEALYRKLVNGPVADRAEAGLGHIAAARGDWQGAADAFARAVKRKPTHAPYLNDLGFALARLGRTDEALFRFRQALELAPGDRLARNNLIVTLEKAGKAEEARRLAAAIASPQERAAAQALLEAQVASQGDPG